MRHLEPRSNFVVLAASVISSVAQSSKCFHLSVLFVRACFELGTHCTFASVCVPCVEGGGGLIFQIINVSAWPWSRHLTFCIISQYDNISLLHPVVSLILPR